MAAPALSVVVPVFNEEGNIAPLVGEIVSVLRGRPPGEGGDFEIVCVDDASQDATLERLRALKPEVPELRVIRHQRRSGQSTATRNGVKAARGTWIATLDGDGQNDPADIPRLLAERDRSPAEVKLFAGWRIQRRDSGSKRIASRIANLLRSRVLRDDTPDSGCGIKLFEREAFLELPYFDHMHRYLPALMQRAGFRTVSVPVHHRPRGSGVSKYGNLGRALAGISDLRGVAWLVRRGRATHVEELE